MRLLALLAFLLPTFALGEEFMSVCDRNLDIGVAIVRGAGHKKCDEITSEDLAAIADLEVNMTVNSGWKSKDFAGLSNLKTLKIDTPANYVIPASLLELLPTVEDLSLVMNDGSRIEEHALDHQTRLKSLWIHSAIIPLSLLENFPLLKRLTLSNVPTGNGIWDVLRDYPQLDSLVLVGNEITRIDSSVLRKMTGLKELGLGMNQITRGLPPDLFTPLVNLEWLSLTNMGISVLDPHWTQSLSKVQFLDLSMNPISSIDSSFLSPLVSLDQLDLSQTLLTSVHRHTFSSLIKLKILSLNHSLSLKKIDDFAFVDLPHLEAVHVTGAPLRETRKAAFHGVPNPDGLPEDFDRDDAGWGSN